MKKYNGNSDLFKNRFQKGSSVYKCENCGKMTRDTGIGEASIHLCKNCYEEMEKENAKNDDSVVVKIDTTTIKAIHEIAYETGNFIQ